MDMMIVEIFLKAFVLCGLLYIVARNEADFEFAKVAMVTAGISLGTFFLDFLLQPRIGILSLIPSFAFVMFMVMKFCWAPFWKAFLVTFLYLLFNIILAVGLLLLMGKMAESQGETVTSKHEADLHEARQMVREMYGMPAEAPPPKPEEQQGKPPSQAEELMKMLKGLFGKEDGSAAPAAPAAPAPITVVPAPTAAPPVVASVTTAPAMRPAVLPAAATAAPPAKAIAPPPPAPPPVSPPAVVEKKPEPPKRGFKAMFESMSGRSKALATADAPGWDSARAKISVSAVMTDKSGSRVAVVNGQMIEEGTHFTLEHDKLIYRWLLKEVQRGRVVWEPAPGEPVAK